MRIVGWLLVVSGLLLLLPLIGPLLVALLAVALGLPLLIGAAVLVASLLIPILLLLAGVLLAKVLFPFILIALGIWLLTAHRRLQAAGA